MVVTGCTLEDAWRKSGGWDGAAIRSTEERRDDDDATADATAPATTATPPPATCLAEHTAASYGGDGASTVGLPSWFVWMLLLLLLLTIVLLVHLVHAQHVHRRLLRDVLWVLRASDRRW